MSGPCCDNCIYSVVDAELWRRLMWMGEEIWPRCANHPLWPGQLHEVTGVACCNYRRKPRLPQGDAVRMIPLGDGFYAYVDAADYEWLSQWTWHAYGDGYAGRREKGKLITMHREIMKPPKGMLVDHVDGNRANDCRLNLRVCTYAENQHNKRKQHGARSQFKGVTYSKRDEKWCAHCRTEGRPRHIGYFDDEVEAAKAYDQAAVERFGEFARVNFPREWPPERRAQVHAQWQKTEDKKKKEKGKSRKANGPAHKRKTHDGRRKTRSKRVKGRRPRTTARSHKRKTRSAPRKTNPAQTRGRKQKAQKTKTARAKRKKTGRPPTPG